LFAKSFRYSNWQKNNGLLRVFFLRNRTEAPTSTGWHLSQIRIFCGLRGLWELSFTNRIIRNYFPRLNYNKTHIQ